MIIAPTPHSLVKQLSNILMAWICGLWLLSSLGVAWYIDSEINENFDAALVETAQRIIDLAEHEIRDLGEYSANIQAQKDNQTIEPKTESAYLMYQVLSEQGKVLLRSTDAPKQALTSSLALGFSESTSLRIYTLRHPKEALFIHVADPLSHRRGARNETLLWLLLPLLGILPLLMLIVRRTVARELKPISQIAADIERRSEQDLTPLDTQNLPKELIVIASSSNHLFVQLKTALESERTIAAQAAHELRTPLAAARMQLAGIDLEKSQQQVVQGVEQAIASLKQLSQRTEKLLQMSRAQGAAALARQPVDLCRLAAEVMQTFWTDADVSNRLHLKFSNQDTRMVHGDHDTLAIALRNLIENALRHAPSGTVWVQVSDACGLSVTDDGEGVDALTLYRLRAETTQTPHDSVGHGLGLSIVKAISQKHGARFEIESPVLGKGTGFRASILF
jgi:two-component system, OmpR family, sensor kinase